MGNFARILPHFWPHRRKFFLATFFACLVALLWSLNLSSVFPVVKVLMEGQSLAEYVDAEIETANLQITKRKSQIEATNEKLEALGPASETPSAERVEMLRYRSRLQSKLSRVTRNAAVMNWLKSNVVPMLPGDQFDLLALILAVVVAMTIFKSLCLFIQEVLIGSVVQLTMMSIRKQCFRESLKLDYQTLSTGGTSDLMSRFTHDMNVLGSGLTLIGGKVMREPLKAIGCIVFAFMVNWRLTLMSFLFVPLVGYTFYRIGRKLKVASRRMMESMSKLYKTLEETFDSLKVVIAFNGASRHRARFHRENKEYYHKAMRLVRIDALTSPSTEILGLLAVFAALLPGAYLVLRERSSIFGISLAEGKMDMAQLSLLYVLLAGVIDPVRKLSTTYAKLKRAAAAADRVFGLMDRQTLVKDAVEPKVAPRHAQHIEFCNVGFRYANLHEDATTRPPVLDNVSLKVTAGEVVVIVGENGSGKSTLVNTLPRYFDPDHGSVKIDGVDIREIRLRDLRDQIGVVTQETLLFDESILENIRYGRPNATRAEIEAAAQQANVGEFIGTLPDGYDTVVGEKGQRLSGGQRQRVALARAILRDPPILILDEATSAIDAHSEKLIHQVLREFARGRTVFIITHSVGQGILDFVNRIAVMDRGRLIAAGPHDVLLGSCPVYQQLYRAQAQQRGWEEPANAEVPVEPEFEPAPKDADSGETKAHILPLRRIEQKAEGEPKKTTGSDGP